MLALFVQLLLAHVLGDFVFQTDQSVKDKELNTCKSKYLYIHLGIHAFLLMLTLQFEFKYWLGMLIVIITHYGIDLAKLTFSKKYNDRLLFFIDQLLHVLVLLIVAACYAEHPVNWEYLLGTKSMLLITSLLLTTSSASVIMRVIISKWKPETEEENMSLDNAGAYIGMLERLFVFGFIVLDVWSGIGFLLTAKSVFRFGDLSQAKDRKLTEYILIGTLLSFGMAILIALIYLRLVSSL